MAPGDIKTVTVAAADAYGPHRDELIHEVGRDKLAPEMQVGVGDRLEGTDAAGKRLRLPSSRSPTTRSSSMPTTRSPARI